MNKPLNIVGFALLAYAVYKIAKSKEEKPTFNKGSSPITNDAGKDSLSVNRDVVSKNVDVFERLKNR